MSATDDPIRAWLARRQEAMEDTAMARALVKAATDIGITDEDQASNVDNLTAGGQPADYEPPDVNEQFQQWARQSTYSRRSEPPPAA